MAAPAPKRPRGGQTLRTPELEEQILAWIADGKTLRAFCRRPGAPKRRTVDQWRETDPAFDARFARAREMGCDELAEQVIEIIDTVQIGEVVTEEDWGESVDGEVPAGSSRKVVREDMLGHRRLQAWGRLQLLAKWDRRYSNKHQHEHKGKVTLESLVEASMQDDDDE